MNRLYLLLFLFISSFTYGQTEIDYVKLLGSTSQNQSIVEKAVKSGLFISRQSFQICDKETGELFGLNGKSEFGIQYSIGVKTPDGFVLVDKAVRPWVYNAKFQAYKEKYDPVFYQARFSELGKQARYDSLDYALTRQEELADTTLYRFSSGTFGGKGFVLDTETGKKEGWVVWVTAGENSDLEQSVNSDYTIYMKEISLEAEKTFFTHR